jgi:hypothetical protein
MALASTSAEDRSAKNQNHTSEHLGLAVAAAAATTSDMEQATSFSNGRWHRNSNTERIYPLATVLLLWIIHGLYIVQWKKRRRRRRGESLTHKLNYRLLVQRKHFYKYWMATLSQYSSSIVAEDTNQNDWRSLEAGGWYTSIHRTMGSYWNDAIQVIPETWRNSCFVERSQHIIVSAQQASTALYTKVGGRSFLSLMYNTHLFWSCRALEQYYGSASYVRLWISVGVIATIMEIGITVHLLRLVSISNKMLQAQGVVDAHENPLLIGFRKWLKRRHFGSTSLTAWTSAVIVIFRFQFPFVSIPILPWIPITRWFRIPPGLSHLCIILILHSLSTHKDEKQAVRMALVLGSMVGFLWGTEWLEFFAEAYYGNWVAFMAMLLTAMSFKARYPSSSLVCLLSHVGWDAKGNLLMFDPTLNRWVDDGDTDEFNVRITSTYGMESESEGEVSDDESSQEDDSERAFPSIHDEAIYGRIPAMSLEIGEIGRSISADHQDNDEDRVDEEMAALLPTSNGNQLRSRRFESSDVAR